MQSNRSLENLIKQVKRKRVLKRAIALMSVVVILVTFNTTKFKADTLQHYADCGFDYDHQHGPECYDASGELVCQLHVHTDACYQTRPDSVASDEVDGYTDTEETTEAVVKEIDQPVEEVVSEPLDLPIVEAESEQVEEAIEEVEAQLEGEENYELEPETVEFESREFEPEEVPLYYVGEQYPFFLSDVLVENDLEIPLSEVVEIGQVLSSDDAPQTLSFERIENDYAIYPIQDCEDQELAIITNTGLMTVRLIEAVVPQWAKEPVQMLEEIQPEDEEAAEEEKVEQITEPEKVVEAEVIEETTTSEEAVEVEAADETEKAEVVEVAVVTEPEETEKVEGGEEAAVTEIEESEENEKVEEPEEAAEGETEETEKDEAVEETAETEEVEKSNNGEETAEAEVVEAAEATEIELTEEAAEGETEEAENAENGEEAAETEKAEEAEKVENSGEATVTEIESTEEAAEGETVEAEKAEDGEEAAETEKAEEAEKVEDSGEATVTEIESTEEAAEGENEEAEKAEDGEEAAETEKAGEAEEDSEPEDDTEVTEGTEESEAAGEPVEGKGVEVAETVTSENHTLIIDLAQVERYPLSLNAMLAHFQPVQEKTVVPENQTEPESPAKAAEPEAVVEAAHVEAVVPEVTADELTDEMSDDIVIEDVEVESEAVETSVEEIEFELGEESGSDIASEEVPEIDFDSIEIVEKAALPHIEYDETQLNVEASGDDYLITPIAPFDSSDIEVDDMYTILLLNSRVEVVAPMPAQSFEGTTKNVIVKVEAEEGAFPEGTTMSLEEIDDEDTLTDIGIAAVGESFVEVQRVHAVDITFRDADGNEIEPLIPISVVMSIRETEQDEDTMVMHVDSEGNAEVVQDVSNTVEEAVEAQPTEAPTESVSFVSDAFSVYAVVVTRKLETKIITAGEETYKITVTYTEDAAIPEGATLEVREIEGEEAEDYLDQAEGAMEEGRQIAMARFFNIKIVDAEENEVQPAVPVMVMVELVNDEEIAPEAVPCAVHFAGEEPDLVKASETDEAITFKADGFSVWGVVYTVDFEYNGYKFSIPGGGFIRLSELVRALGIVSEDEAASDFMAKVASVEFSSPELACVTKVAETASIGTIKADLALECEYSLELTEEDIEAINTETVEAGDWALISLKPFTSEETLTITMANGGRYVVKVTDAQVASTDDISEEKEYVLYTYKDGKYYVLKTDGSTVYTTNKDDLDTMGHEYKWKFDYIYTEDVYFGPFKIGEKPYYRIMPSGDNTRMIRLDSNTTFPYEESNSNPLVASGTFQMFIVPSGTGFKFEGYNNAKLKLDNGWFASRMGDAWNYDEIVIYEPGQLEMFDFTVTSDDYLMGKVCGTNKENQYKEDAEFDAKTNGDKFNQYEIKAVPQTSRYMFDYWDLNGVPIDNGATIPAGTLSIPYQGSKLTAHFKKDPNWQASDEEKEGRVIDKESFQKWLNELKERNIPLNTEGCTKTAELYDYENRIYRVDLTAQSNLSMFNGDIDLGFIIDVSGSMQFPSKLDPIPGYESIDVLHLNDTDTTKNSIDKNKTYFFVVDRTNTANVIYLKWGHWPTGSPSSTSTKWYDGWGISGYGYESDEIVEASVRYYTSAGHALFGGDNGPFQLYTAGDNGKRRREYLESSIAGTLTELNSILGDLAYAKNAGEAADVKVAYNTFANDVDYDHTNHNFVSVTSGLSIGYDYKGGTDTEEALTDADNFFWNDSATKVAVLITDGAPQQSGVDGPTLDARVKAAADTLKNQGIKLITIGLSMGDVKRGSRLLYDIATKDSDGDPYFYKADTGDELQYALYEVIQKVMADAIVVGNVTDTLNEAFYPVDKDTGMPLEAGNVIDLNGVKIADNESTLTNAQKAVGYGVIGIESGNYKVTWNNQNITWGGWHGTIYEKAKEDFLGGNAVRTNDPANAATIVPMGYKIKPEDSTIAFKDSITTEKTKSLETPRVNVNELDLTENKTEWTVYKGTEVDPKAQLEKLYDNIIVKEVVTAATDVDGDGFPDRMTGTSMFYPLEESTSDERESSGSGHQLTFKLKDLLKKLNSGTEITVDDLISVGDDGYTFIYDLYGQDCPGTLSVKLTKTGDTANYDPHITTVTGDAVETYELSVKFVPDYVHLPSGQGGDDSKPYHTGTYSLAYPGPAAGEDYSNNTHVINVYEVPLDVYKTDEKDKPLAGATFKLYRLDDENGSEVDGLNVAHKYVEVAAATSGTDGVAQLQSDGAPFGLVLGEKYYLIETEAPENYIKVNTVWEVEVQTEIGKFTDLEGGTLYSQTHPITDDKGGVTDDMYPFNWDQGARVVLDGKDPVLVIAKGETEDTTTNITDGSFVSHKKAIAFRHIVQNKGGVISIDVHKTWKGDEKNPDSVTVKLYRVSEKDHVWGEGTVVPCTCTAAGVKKYTCAVCGAEDTYVITEADHTPGTAHRENVVEVTCTTDGSYDTVVRCTVCNAIISSEHTDVPAPGHKWGEAQEEEPTLTGYCYDTVVRCTVCGAERENTRVHHEHVWGDWQVTTEAQPGVAGEKTRICEHGHTETEEIPALPVNHTVNIYFRCTGNGDGGTDYMGQITELAYRSGTGSGNMTIEWNWDQWTNPQKFVVDGLIGGSTYSTSSSSTNKGAKQTLTISNITSDMTLYVTIKNGGYKGTNDGLIGQPDFADTKNLTSRSLNARMKLNAMPLLGADPDPANVGEGTSGTTVPEVLRDISGLKSKQAAACGDKYWEEVSGTYEVTADGGWKLNIPNLPKYNEYGKAYTYYVEEIPVTGYDTTYSGQGTATPEIINTLKTTELKVTKEWAFAANSRIEKVEGKQWPKDVTVHVAVYSKTGENEPAPTDYTIDLTADKPEHTFTGLPEYSNGEKVEYSVVEAGVTGLDSENFDTTITGSAEEGYVIRNTEALADLTILKVDADGMTTPLAGAVFTIQQIDEATLTPVAGASPVTATTTDDATDETEDDGVAKFAGLQAGYYVVRETRLPAGYVQTGPGYFYIRVEGGEVKLIEQCESDDGEMAWRERTGDDRLVFTAAQGTDPATVKVGNERGAALPATGGPGTTIFYTTGIGLIALAVFMFLRKWESL